MGEALLFHLIKEIFIIYIGKFFFSNLFPIITSIYLRSVSIFPMICSASAELVSIYYSF